MQTSEKQKIIKNVFIYYNYQYGLYFILYIITWKVGSKNMHIVTN